MRALRAMQAMRAMRMRVILAIRVYSTDFGMCPPQRHGLNCISYDANTA